MSEENYKKKTIIMAIITAGLIVGIFIVSMLLIKEINFNRSFDKKKEIITKVYATISEVGDNYIKVIPVDESIGTSLMVNTKDRYKEGDFILILYNEDEESYITPNSIEVIAHKDEVNLITTKSTTTTQDVYNSTTKVNTTKINKTTKTSVGTTTKTVNKNADEVVLSYVKSTENDIVSYNETTTFKERAKASFIKIIDFIFYDGEIKGVTWDELSNKAKAKVVYYALIIDNKIDNKWPNYKENTSNKLNDIKERLIAKYMDLTANICSNHPNECAQTKEDFKLLKKSLNLTWDILKSAFKYGYDKTTNYLKTWYEVFSGK